jgi:hypothetical protein
MSDEMLEPEPAAPDNGNDAEFDPIIVKIPIDDDDVRYLLKFKGERPKLDYKSAYDDSEKRDAVEIVKDIVAMANTEGGFIVLGAENNGAIRGLSDDQAVAVDDAKIVSRLQNYLGTTLDIHVSHHTLDAKKIAVVAVSRAIRVPLIFLKDGQYGHPSREVFRVGDVFVRHSSKSERWNQEDVLRLTQRVVERERNIWLRTVLPDIHAAFGITAAMFAEHGGAAALPTAQAVLLQDAEQFTDVVKDILRRNR